MIQVSKLEYFVIVLTLRVSLRITEIARNKMVKVKDISMLILVLIFCIA